MGMEKEMEEFIDLNKNKKISMFVDMDGVIASYRFGEGDNIKNNVPGTYLNKRLINTVLNNILSISKKFNFDLYILSSCLYNEQVKEKEQWLDKYAQCFEKDKRYFVLPQDFEGRKDMKIELLDKVLVEKNIDIAILIEDTHDTVFKAIDKLGSRVKPYHVISFVD